MKTLAGIFTSILPVKQQNQTISDRRRAVPKLLISTPSFFFPLSFSLSPHTLTCTQTRFTPSIEVISEKIK